MIGRRLPYLQYIDGLRGLAVLAVVIYHLAPALLPGGFVGVDVFFVISGFVVSRSTSTLRNERFGAVLLHFYAHRVARIVPALVACLVITMLASALFIPQSWLSGASEKTGLHAFFGFSNVILARTDNDYFAPKAGFNPFTHTWSLGVEEQFYLIFPLLFISWLRPRRNISITLFCIGFVASLASALYLTRTSQSVAFYSLSSRFWELAAGVLLAQVLSMPKPDNPGLHLLTAASPATPILSFFCLAFSLFITAPQWTPFPGSLLPCAAAVSLLAAPGESGPVAWLLNWGPLRRIGRISYALYLWHWPIFVLFRWTTGLDSWPLRLAALTLALLAASASTTWIEAPIRRSFGRTGLSNRRVIAYGIVALGAGYGAATAILALRPTLSLSTVTRHRADWYQDEARLNPGDPGCRAHLNDLHLPDAEAWSAKREGCALPATFPHALFVLGDSHATAYTVMLRGFVRQTGAHLYLYSEGGCSFFGLSFIESAVCGRFEAAAAADILRRLSPGDVIFLPSLRLPRLTQEYASFGEASADTQMFSPEAARDREAGAAKIIPLLTSWSAHGGTIVFEAPPPVLKAPPFRCADWFDRNNPICAGGPSIDRATLLHLRAPVMAAFMDFQKTVPRLHVWDPLAVLCPDTMCQAYRNGEPLLFDGDHLSGFGNRLLLPTFKSYILALNNHRP